LHLSITAGLMSVTGEISIDDVGEFSKGLQDLLGTEADSYVIDLTRVAYMSSACMGAFAHRISEHQGQISRIAIRARQNVARVIERSGLADHITLEIVSEGA